jgi:hypothetical protein
MLKKLKYEIVSKNIFPFFAEKFRQPWILGSSRRQGWVVMHKIVKKPKSMHPSVQPVYSRSGTSMMMNFTADSTE